MNRKILSFAQHMMSGRTRFNRKGVSVAAAVVLVSLVAIGLVVRARASVEWHEQQGLVGSWRLLLTPVNCPSITGTPGAPFEGLASFTGDGTLINTFANALFRYDTPGHGFWWKTGDRTYKDVFEVLIVDPPATTPYVAGTQKGFASITLDDGNDFSAQVVAEYFNSSGAIYLTKCVDVAGTRINDSQTEP